METKQGRMNDDTERIRCDSFDWRVSVTLGSDKMSVLEEPMMQLFITNADDSHVKTLEFTIEEAEAFVKQLSLLSAVCQ